MARSRSTRMARGGMYDQLGGGFHRYSVDDHWLVPHFEKMLYDNAQLASLYLHAWLATGDPEYRRVARRRSTTSSREMRHPSGGFFSAQDADSEGVEGKFFVWSPDEIAPCSATTRWPRRRSRYWGVSDGPNFEGQSILFVPRAPDDVAAELGISADRLSRARRAGAAAAVRGARQARAPGPRRQGARLVERPGALGLRGGRAARWGDPTTSPPRWTMAGSSRHP